MVNPSKQRKGSGIDFVFPEKGNDAGAAVEASASPAPVHATAAPAARPAARTGVGLLSASIFESHKLEEEIRDLKGQVERLGTERGAQLMDPHSIAASRWANRHPDAFVGKAFEDLKGEIADSGGNVQPIKVRPLAASKGDVGVVRYEVVYGHRRHRACLDLGLPVLVVVDDLDDAQLYVEMERENRGRENLSAWEQGRMYLRALDEGLFSSNIRLAAAIGRDPSDVGKAMRIAKLPPELTGAFASPLQIQFQWVTDLERALKEYPDLVFAAARSLGAQTVKAGPAEVFRGLTACLRGEGVGSSHPTRTVEFGGGKKAIIRVDARGRTTIQLSAGALLPGKFDALEVALKRLVQPTP
jgi:ParB family transcriptional regulator, chromosome partitioning protein